MNKKDLKRFKTMLEESKRQLLVQAKKTLTEEASFDTDDLPDEIDLASSEYTQSMIFRLRDREKFLLAKIDKALARIENGTFGICEKCEEEIRRSASRPVRSRRSASAARRSRSRRRSRSARPRQTSGRRRGRAGTLLRLRSARRSSLATTAQSGRSDPEELTADQELVAGRSRTRPVRRRNVPFELPRSSTVTTSPFTSSRAWRAET